VFKRLNNYFLILVMLFCVCLVLSCARTAEQPGTAYVYNRVDELLAGDLDDTVSVADVRRRLRDDSVGLGTTSMSANGEVVITGKAIFWVDPEDASVREITDPGETLPFCAVAYVPSSASRFELSGGDLKEMVLARCRETGDGLLALKIVGEFDDVKVSVAKTIPRSGFDFENPGKCLAYFTEGEADWVMVGFYAASAENQRILSVEGHPVHIHGVNGDRSFGGHIQKAKVKKAVLFTQPITTLNLANK